MEGPEEPEFRLLDPGSGLTEIVTGEFAPMEQHRYRPFQRVSSTEDERVWAAIPDRQRNATSIGTYDVVSFEFVRLETIPSIAFETADMWVAEESGVLYVSYGGDLLSLPFTPSVRTGGKSKSDPEDGD